MPLPAIQPLYLLFFRIMDLKIIPPPSSGLQPKLIESFDPSETMAALQQALVREFFGEPDEPSSQEVAGCIVSAFGKVSEDAAQLVGDFIDLDSAVGRMISQPIDADDKSLGYGQKRPRYTLRVQRWIGSSSAENDDEETKFESSAPPEPTRPPARRRSRESVLRIVEAVDETAHNLVEARQPCTLDLSTVPDVSASVNWLVGVDGSEGAHLGFTTALELFNAKTKDNIELLHVFDKSKAFLPFDLEPDYIRQQYEMLLLPVPKDQKSVTLIAKPDDPDLDFANFEILTKFGTKGLVCRYANDRSWPDGIDGPTHRKPDVLVVGFIGRKGPKQDPTILGSCVDYSIRAAACTSLIAKKRLVFPLKKNTQKYCVAVDGSAASHHGFVETLRIMNRDVDEILVVTFYSANRTRETAKKDTELITQYKLALGEVGCKRGEVKLVEKEVGVSLGRAISAFAFENDISILCVGADGMQAFAEGRTSTQLGSVSDYCVKNAKCSVLVAQVNTVV